MYLLYLFIEQAALKALTGALDVVRAAMAQHPDSANVVERGQRVLNAGVVHISFLPIMIRIANRDECSRFCIPVFSVFSCVIVIFEVVCVRVPF